jgi:hypothetical protein
MYNWYHSSISGILYIHGHRLRCTTIHGAFPMLLSPLASSPFLPLCTPFYLLGTLLAVTGIVHLGLRLLVNWPPLSYPSPRPSPLQIPRTPTAQRLTKTTSGIIRHLLSGTLTTRFTTVYCRWLYVRIIRITVYLRSTLLEWQQDTFSDKCFPSNKGIFT